MAVLSDAERHSVAVGIMRLTREERGTVSGMTKADLRAAVDAVDGWIDQSANSFNASLPQAARNNLSAKQKALIFMHVMTARWGAS